MKQKIEINFQNLHQLRTISLRKGYFFLLLFHIQIFFIITVRKFVVSSIYASGISYHLTMMYNLLIYHRTPNNQVDKIKDLKKYYSNLHYLYFPTDFLHDVILLILLMLYYLYYLYYIYYLFYNSIISCHKGYHSFIQYYGGF
jgi:hypothetical protein